MAGGSFADFLAEQDEAGRVNRPSLLAASQMTPDEAGEAQRLAPAAGLPVDVVARNLDDVRKQKQQRDFESFLQETELGPLATDTNFLAVAQDSAEELGAVKQTVTNISATVKRIIGGFEAAVAAGGDTRLAPFKQRVRDRENERRAERGLPPLGAETVRQHGMQLLREAEAEFNALAPYEAIGEAEGFWGTTGAVAGFIAEQAITSLPEMLASAVAPIGLGVSYSGQIGAERAGREAPGRRGKESTLGGIAAPDLGDVATAAPAAAAMAALNRFGADKVLGLFAELGATAARRIGAAALSEGLTEVAQEEIQYVAERLGIDPIEAHEMLALIPPTLLGAAGAGAMIRTGMEGIDIAERMLAKDEQKAKEATEVGKMLDELTALAEAAKIRERNPEQLEKFIAALDPATEVYVDAEALMQSDLELPEQIEARISEAAATNTPVRFTAAEYATYLAPAAAQLNKKARIGKPDALNVEEAAQVEAEFEARAAAIEKQAAASEELANEAEQVRQQMLAQIVSTGRFRSDVADAYAALVRDFYVTTAARAGTTPAQLFARYPLRVQARGADGGLDQLPPEDIKLRDEGEEGFYLEAEGGHAALLRVRRKGGAFRVRGAEVKRKGEGTGQQLLALAYQEAKRRGLPLQSDSEVSAEQLRAYDALRRKGWTIEYAKPDQVAAAIAGKRKRVTVGHDSPVVTRIEPPAELSQSAALTSELEAQLQPVAALAADAGELGAGYTRFRHFGNFTVPVLDPAFMGTGLKGEERKRMSVNVLSLYPDTGFEREVGTGNTEYVVDVPTSKLYDVDADPLGLKQQARQQIGQMGDGTPIYGGGIDFTRLEELIRDQGFEGYVRPQAPGNLRGQARLFNPVPVIGGKRDPAADIPRADELPPDMREIETRFADWLANNYDEAVRQYNALEESQGGRVLNTDIARELSPDYRNNRGLSAAVHEPASWFINKLYAQRLREAPKGNVLFTAGGTGAGKSSALRGKDLESWPIIFDTNIAKAASGRKKIDQALAAGREVDVYYVFADPLDSFQRAVKRTQRMAAELGTGRTVPLWAHVGSHVGSRKAIPELMEQYANDERVAFSVMFNEPGVGAREVDIAELPELSYDHVREVVEGELESQYKAGKVSEAEYQAFRSEGATEATRPAGREVGPGESELQGTVVNVGLATNDGAGITPEQVRAAFAARGINIEREALQQSDTEQTLVLRLSRPLTQEEGDAISAELQQEAIAHVSDGQGTLFGPQAENWGPFNPEFFMTFDGRRLSEVKPVAYRGLQPGRKNPRAGGARVQWYTSDKDSAARYAGDTGTTSAAEIDLKNPLVIDAQGARWDNIKYGNEWYSTDELVQVLAIRNRHDGIIIKNVLDDADMDKAKPSTIYAVFDDKAAQPLQQSARGSITETPEFKRWFGDSKVVDENGEPLVVYHGTRGDFDTFDAGRQGQSDFGASGRGFYFSQDPGTANVYATLSPADGAPNIVPVYLRLENPLELGAMLPQNEEQSRALTEAAKEAGHDGIVVRGADGALDEAVVFHPEQIKSAIGNRGTFDPNDPNMLHQPGGAVRGTVTLGRDMQADPAVISLLEKADLSTFLHESGHFFFEVMTDLASREGAPAEIVADVQTLFDWTGWKGTAAEWRAAPIDTRRAAHEQFARGFEAWLMEGTAPTQEQRRLFQRFRAWLLNIYRSLVNLNVQLTDEVRGVMGRMLATREMIAAAEAERGLQPLFTDQMAAGMTPEEWQSYQENWADATQNAQDQLQARSLRNLRWLANAKSRELAKLQKANAAKRAEVRAEVESEIAQRPERVAETLLLTGTAHVLAPDGSLQEIKIDGPHKLSTERLAALYGTTDDYRAVAADAGIVDTASVRAPWHSLPKNFLAKKGLDPNELAELVGMTSGDQLVTTLLAMAPREQLIEQMTDARVLQKYGDLNNAREMERAVDIALHNQMRTRVIAAELAALDKATTAGKRDAWRRAAREFAARVISRRKVRDLRPGQFAAAEGKAARAAAEALAAGDMKLAAQRKRDQLFNGYASREASRAQERVEKGVEYLRSFATLAKRKNLDPAYRDQIDKLLERFDLRNRSLREIDKRESLLKWVEQQREQGHDPAIPEELLDEAQRTSYRNLTVEQLDGLVDAVKNIEHLSRLKNRLLKSRRQKEFDKARDELVKSIEEHAPAAKDVQLERDMSLLGKAGQLVTEWFTSLRKLSSLARVMDGGADGGLAWEYFVRPLNEAADVELKMRAAATKKLNALMNKVPGLNPGVFARVGRKVTGGPKLFIPAINRSLTLEARIAVALNWGNEGNRQRLIDGNKWSPMQVQAIIDTLSKEEMDFVQGVFDLIGSYWNDIKEKEQRVTGVAPEGVSPLPIRTRHGEYRGGYYPIVADPLRSERAVQQNDAELIAQSLRGAVGRATTRRGHTKERVGGKDPVRLDLAVIPQHISQVTHDLAWHETLIDYNKLLRDPQVSGLIRERYGADVTAAMRRVADDVARGEVAARTASERMLNYLRVGSTTVGLGLSVTTTLLQLTGFSQSFVRVGYRPMASAILRYAAHPVEATRQVYAKSEFMQSRSTARNRELGEIFNRLDGKKRPMSALYFFPIQALQTAVDVPTWLGAYNKALQNGETDDRAVHLADQAVRDAQSSGQVHDLAEVQRGGPLMKLLTNFYSYFSATYQLAVESGKTFGREKSLAAAVKLATDYLMLVTVPVLMGSLLKEGLRGDEDDDELAAKLVKEHVSYALGMYPIVRELAGAVEGIDYRGPAGLSFFGDATGLAKQAAQGEVDEAFLRALNRTAGTLLHYPAGQVDRTVRGMVAVAEGDAGPQAILVGPPVER